MQEYAQMTEWRQELESQLHTTNLREVAHLRRNYEHLRRHRALSKDLATEKQQHGNTRQELSAVKQKNLQLADELKVGLLISLPILCEDYFVGSGGRGRINSSMASQPSTQQPYMIAVLRMHATPAEQ